MKPLSKIFAALVAVIAIGSTQQAFAKATTGAPTKAPVPVVSFNKDLKQVVLNWLPVTGATYYTIKKSPSGQPQYNSICLGNSPTATTCADTYSKITDFITATYVVSACNAVGCIGSTPVAAVSKTTVQYLKAAATSMKNLGFSAAISADGNTLAVSGFDSATVSSTNIYSAGTVYVFTRVASSWSQQSVIRPINSDPLDAFGYRMAFSADGNTLAITAEYESSAARGINGDQTDNNAKDSGAAYIYVRSGSTWIQQAFIKASDSTTSDRFGFSVALSSDGNTLAVGSVQRNRAYVFTRNGTSWSEQSVFVQPNWSPIYNTWFGNSIALSADGNTLAIGAWYDNNYLSNSGAVYVYTRSGTVWTQQGMIKAPFPGMLDEFACSISLSADGNTLAVGAAWEDSSAVGVNGAQGDNSSTDSGAAYVYTRLGSSWSLQAYLKASNTNASDWFGISVSLSSDGNTLAVSAVGEDSGFVTNQADNSVIESGAVYLFSRTGTTWQQAAYVKAPTVGRYDNFGLPVLSGDGTTLAVGVMYEDSAATTINGNQADNTALDRGAVFVY